MMSMKREILGDTDLETIISDFARKKCGVMKLFVVDSFQKAQSDRDHGASINLLLSILRNLTPSQLPYSALT